MNLIKYLNLDKEKIKLLDNYIKEVTPSDKTNREGLAAKVYFFELFGNDFKRFSQDVINAGLNYGYAILRSQISKSIISKGLNTMLGLFHKGPNNYFNLSDDLIEPFRPIIDIWVYQNLREEKIFKKEHKFELIKQTTKKVLYKNKKQTIFNAISMYVDDLINYFESEKDLYDLIIDYNDL